MSKIKKYIYEQVALQKLTEDDAKQMLVELKNSTKDDDIINDIAVIGMSCNFPKSKDIDEYWNNLREGRSCIGTFPESRNKDIEHIFSNPHYVELLGGTKLPSDKKLAEEDFNLGGYLEDVDKFDAAFFNIPPREAKFMEPLQRLFLESVWSAIEDAGYGGNKIKGSNTGVYVGRDFTSGSMYKYFTEPDAMHMTGSWTAIMASRVSYLYNLKGPCMVIDTACSSGLVSVHTACRAIRNKECDMAIAGGVCIGSTSLKGGEGNSLNSVESDDCIVRTFDRDANGTVWGEGIAAIVLKPLKDALRDKDQIHAVIKGSAINNDGTSNGITAPNASAQEEVIVDAWKDAKINPETISYIEAHGTGTVLGDPIELKGLSNAFRRYTDKKQFCAIGSVKTNVGHLVAASGMASIIKVILSLKNKKMPPTINFRNPNPYVDFNNMPIYINDRLKSWVVQQGPRRAGVSSFGFSGTNCHVVLEEAPEIKDDRFKKDEELFLLKISAKSENVLKNFVGKYYKYTLKLDGVTPLENICYTANTGRGDFEYRIILIVRNLDDFRDKVEFLHEKGIGSFEENGIYYGKHKVITDKKNVIEAGEIKEKEKNEFTKAANDIINKWNYVSGNAKEELLSDICKYYVMGADIKWEELYEFGSFHKTSVPVYPFERVRYWAPNKTNQLYNKEIKTAKKEIGHPLVDRCITKSIFQDIYTTDFSVDSHWVLSDHKVMGNSVIPGTTYLEMAREVCSNYYPNKHIQFKDIIFIAPLVVQQDEVKEVHTIIKKKNGYVEFVIASKNIPNEASNLETWITHVEGKAYVLDEEVPEKWDIDLIEVDSFEQKIIIDYESIKSSTGTFSFGPRWFNVEKAAKNKNEVFAEIKIPDDLSVDLNDYVLHPAMLDNAVNIASQSFGEGVYLPLTYKSFKLFNTMPNNFYSYMRKKDKETKNLETISFDIDLMDMDGNVFAEINDYTIKKVHNNELKTIEKSGKRNVYHEIGWIEESMSDGSAKLQNGVIILLDSEKELSSKIIEKLRDDKKETIQVKFGNNYEKINDSVYVIDGSEKDFNRLFEELKNKEISYILHTWTITEKENIQCIEDLEEQKNQGIYSLFNMTKSLISSRVKGQIDVVLIGENVNNVNGEEKVINPHSAALFGLGKVVAQENPNLICRCIDVDAMTPCEIIYQEICAEYSVFQVAYRIGKRYVEEFRKIDLADRYIEEYRLKKDGVYLILGGTGGLGLTISKYLSSIENINLALVNRTKLPSRERWNEIIDNDRESKLSIKLKNILEIEALGSKVDCFSADISNYYEMENLIDEIKLKFGKINGIVHAAGVAGDGFIIRKEKNTFDQVVIPKIDGTWIIDKLTEKEDLDLFIMFSSITSIFGAPGQGDYTAANAYLDAFSDYRNQKGKKTLTINWPAWNEVGMAVEYGVTDDVVLLKSINTKTALDVFGEILNTNIRKIVPQELNYELIATLGIDIPIKLSAEIKEILKKVKEKVDSNVTGIKKMRKAREVTVKGKGGQDYTETEYIIAQIYSEVLDFGEIDIYESFYALGGDSILATHLLRAIESVYPGLVDISDIFSYSSVVELAEYIDNKRSMNNEIGKINEGRLSENNEDKELKALLDKLESGQESIESAINKFEK